MIRYSIPPPLSFLLPICPSSPSTSSPHLWPFSPPFFLSLPFSRSNYNTAYQHLVTNNPHPFFSLHTSVIPSTLFAHLCLDLSFLTEGGGGWRWRVTCEERKMTTRRTQGGRKWETGERDWKLVPQSRRKDSRGEEIREGGESSKLRRWGQLYQNPLTSLLFVRGIKEEDTQSGFSLRPYRQHTQRTALTAAEGDSGGGRGWGGELMGEGKRGMKVVWEGWQGGEKQDDEGKGGGGSRKRLKTRLWKGD